MCLFVHTYIHTYIRRSMGMENTIIDVISCGICIIFDVDCRILQEFGFVFLFRCADSEKCATVIL